MILTGLIFIFFQLTDLAQEMRRQGVDIFPDCDSHCYIEGLPLKDIQTERHLYHCMALTANSLNFTWSRWNLLSGYDKLIMQYREKLPGAPGKKLAVFVIEIPMGYFLKSNDICFSYRKNGKNNQNRPLWASTFLFGIPFRKTDSSGIIVVCR